MNKTNFSRLTVNLLSTLFLLAFLTAQPSAQTESKFSGSDRARALELIKQNRYLDALPLLEKAAQTEPTDPDFWAEYSIAIYYRAMTLNEPEARRREMLAARAIAVKARKLGSNHPRVVEMLEKVPEDGWSGKFADDPKVDAALREAENLFHRGEYDKAFVAYERAHKLDPQNYEAPLFAGDCFYSKKEYAKAEPWFAKAVAIDPNREIAFRFWGDALMHQGKTKEAGERYIEAVIAEPFLRTTWDGLQRWAADGGNGWSPTPVVPPGGKAFGEIAFDESLLKVEDGTNNWQLYKKVREAWKNGQFKKEFPGAAEYRHSLREETAALRAVAEAAKKDFQTGKTKVLHKSLENLIKINDAGLLEAYVLFPRVNGEIAEDYEDYRQNNRDKLRRFLAEFLVGVKNSTSKDKKKTVA